MQVSLTFDPKADKHDHVADVVNAVFGVKKPAVSQTESASLVSAAQTPSDASPAAATAPETQSTLAAPAAANLAPNASTAPTQQGAAPAATNSSASVELDSKGLPWDARIHSSSKKTNKDGSWAKRKGVSDLEVSKVSQELLNLMAAQVGVGAPPAGGVPAGGVMATPAAMAPAPAGNPVNVPHQTAVQIPGHPNAFVPADANGQAPAGATPPTGNVAPMPAAGGIAPFPTLDVPAPQAKPNDFNSLMGWLSGQMAPAGLLQSEHVAYFCKQCGITDADGNGNIALAANRPDAIDWLYEAFCNQIKHLSGQV